ncbi:MAG: prolyl oligopeptidase family serine peptidase [Candidatus Thorarchaeota archaeon]
MAGKKILSYHQWEPILTPEEIFADAIALGEIKVVDDKIYWAEMRPIEQGRIVLVCQDASGEINDILPPEFNVRTRVHEYGGMPYAVTEKDVFFANFQDQRLYRKKLADKSPPLAMTPEKNADGSLGKYGAPIVSPDGKFLVFVYEKEWADKENENFIALLDIEDPEVQEPTILAQGHDFYFDPAISPSSTKIAWIQYDHPNMPWNSSMLVIADFKEGNIVTGSERTIIADKNVSVCSAQFDSNDNLYFVMDEANQPEDSPKNWYNLYRYDGERLTPITQELAEFAGPAWAVGLCNYAILPDGQIVANYAKKGRDYLGVIHPETKEVRTLDSPFAAHSDIGVLSDQEIVFVGTHTHAVTAIVKFNIKSMEIERIKSAFSAQLLDEDISSPTLIEYPTSDGQQAYGQLYLPKNSKYQAPEEEKPPLIVMVHGGPTGRAPTHLSLIRQFWTSAGYAILDVDHRGSTSYGRQYRDALEGQWGVIDSQDVKDGVDHLISQGIVAPKVAITGGSAGGYAVQRALTMFPDTFQVGASYYGIGNLITLTKLTHKFESRYMDWLVGAQLPEGEAVFKERSPINYLDNLKSPMILFQGAEDQVVTPEVSREIADILKEKGIESDYIEYEGETHGFLRKDSNVDSLTREAAFFRKVLFR